MDPAFFLYIREAPDLAREKLPTSLQHCGTRPLAWARHVRGKPARDGTRGYKIVRGMHAV